MKIKLHSSAKEGANFLPFSSSTALRMIGCVYFLAMLLFGLDRHWSFKTSINDAGVFDHAIWSYIQDGVFVDTINLSTPINWLGFHFNLILFLFVPLYWLYPAPEWLILSQALAIAATAWPIYKSARQLHYSDGQALLWALGFLLNPFVVSAAMWDFHPVAIATPFIAWSLYYLLTQEFNKLLPAAFIVLLCQEQFGILVLCLGLAYYLMHRDFKKSAGLVALGIIYTAFVFYYAFPKLSPTGTHLMMSREMSGLSRYGWLGRTLFEIAGHFFSHPWAVLKTALIDMEVYRYIILLLLPYGFLPPLLGFEFLLVGAADFAANALSLIPLQRSVYGYHSIALIPAIIIAAMTGFNRLRNRFSSKIYFRAAYLTVAAFLILNAIFLPRTVAGKDSLWNLSLLPIKTLEIADIKQRIPGHAAVSAQANIGSHFSQRELIYAYPRKAAEADYVILRMEDPNGILFDETFRFRHHMLMDPKNYLASIQCFLAAGTHRVEYFNPPWLILLKSPKPVEEMPSLRLTYYLGSLAKRWHSEETNPAIDKCV
jgi:uncharacterized membrane protein